MEFANEDLQIGYLCSVFEKVTALRYHDLEALKKNEYLVKNNKSLDALKRLMLDSDEIINLLVTLVNIEDKHLEEEINFNTNKEKKTKFSTDTLFERESQIIVDVVIDYHTLYYLSHFCDNSEILICEKDQLADFRYKTGKIADLLYEIKINFGKFLLAQGFEFSKHPYFIYNPGYDNEFEYL